MAEKEPGMVIVGKDERGLPIWKREDRVPAKKEEKKPAISEPEGKEPTKKKGKK